MARAMASGRSSDMDQAGPSSAPSDPLPGTFVGPSLDITSEKLYDLAPDIPDVMGLRALRLSAAVVKVMSVPDSQCIQVVTPDDHVKIGFHEILLHDMGADELPFVATSELNYLRGVWPRALFAFMTRYQQDLECMCKERFGSTQSGNCTHCGKYIQRDLGKHIAFYHLERAQLWRCPVMWCTVWKGIAQDCIDHMRRIHKVPMSVKVTNLARFFLPWTVTREQWADMMMPSISGVAIDTCCSAALARLYVIAIESSVGLSRGFAGHVITLVACLPRRIKFHGGAPAPSPACSGTSRTNSASYGHSGKCAIPICSWSPDCFPDATASSTERSCRFVWRAGIGVLYSDGDVFCTGIDGTVTPLVRGTGRWASSNSSAVVDCV